MNGARIVQMAMRMLMRRLVRRGVDAGIDRAFGAAKPEDEMTPDERKQARAGKQNARRARKAMRLGRRIGKF